MSHDQARPCLDHDDALVNRQRFLTLEMFRFEVYPIERFAGAGAAIKRPVVSPVLSPTTTSRPGARPAV